MTFSALFLSTPLSGCNVHVQSGSRGRAAAFSVNIEILAAPAAVQRRLPWTSSWLPWPS